MALQPAKKTLTKISTRTLRVVAPQLSLKVAERAIFTPKRRLNAWPNNVQQFSIPTRYGDVQAYKMGTGKCIWFVHGWSSCAFDFLTMMRFLSDMGYCCISFDFPGHGGSLLKGSNLPKMINAFDDIADVLFKPSMVVTHGTGASIVANSNWFEKFNNNILLVSPILNDYKHLQGQMAKQGVDSTLFEQIVYAISKKEKMFIPDLGCRDKYVAFSGRFKIIHDKYDGIAQYEESQLLASESDCSMHGTTHLGHHKILRSKALMKVIDSFGLLTLETELLA